MPCEDAGEKGPLQLQHRIQENTATTCCTEKSGLIHANFNAVALFVWLVSHQ
jgi:hypothetical protein